MLSNPQPRLYSFCCPCSRQHRPRSADEVKFDVRLMQRVPYEGVSRMQTSLRRKREPLPAPNPPLFRPHADPAHRARVALCRSRSCRAPRIGPDHRVGLCAFPAASNPRPQKPVSRPCRLPVRSTRPMPGVSASTHLGTITPLDTDAPLLALHRHFADQLTSIRYWSAPRPLATPLLSHTHAHAHSRSSRVPRSVQETCNFDVLYACVSAT